MAKVARGRHFIRDGGTAAPPPKAMLDPGLCAKYHLHGNSYNNMDLECVYIEFDNLNFNSVA